VEWGEERGGGEVGGWGGKESWGWDEKIST
jgi:hypothetical protein